ncbi:MAG TPA: DUF4893 domain-containing protein [Sphingomonas sp.]
MPRNTPIRSSALIPGLCAALLLAGCAGKAGCPPAGSAVAAPMPDWRDLISDPDHVRLRAWRESFVAALDQARKDGHGAEIDAAGPLLDPDLALDGATLVEGAYRCRTIKLGNKVAGHASYVAYPAYPCVVRHGDPVERLAQTEGVQRPIGRLYQDGTARMVFLGTMELSDEPKAIRYGRDNDRDLVGAVQRVGDHRWRMLLPRPAWESMMDVMEITPAG